MQTIHTTREALVNMAVDLTDLYFQMHKNDTETISNIVDRHDMLMFDNKDGVGLGSREHYELFDEETLLAFTNDLKVFVYGVEINVDKEESYLQSVSTNDTGGNIYNDVITLKDRTVIRVSENTVQIFKNETADEENEPLVNLADFPNGFYQWRRSHFIIISHILGTQNNKHSMFAYAFETDGVDGPEMLANFLTAEFEESVSGKQWAKDADYLKELSNFLRVCEEKKAHQQVN